MSSSLSSDERKAVAAELAAELAAFGLTPLRLPFIEDPDHDALLEAVRQGIRECDLFVCIPGSRPSFVENERSMAFGLDKPLLFVVQPADTPRLPNTAKKGYPIFSLESRSLRSGFGRW